MKLTKLTLVGVAFATLAGSAAYADNSTLRTLIDLDRQRMEREKRANTVAVYANRHGAGQEGVTQSERTGSHFEWRWNANGQRFGLFVPDKKETTVAVYANRHGTAAKCAAKCQGQKSR